MAVSVFTPPDFPRVGRIDYSDYWRDRGFEINKKLKEREHIMLKLIPEGSSVFDIGCGNSLLPIELAQKRRCHVTVGDVSSIVLDGYKKLGIAASVIDLNRIQNTDLSEEPYDYIVMSEVLEHMTNPEEIIAMLRSHARRFLLTIPNSAFYPFRLRLFFGGRFLKQWVHHPSEHVRFWSHTDFVDWLSVQGLVLEKAVASNGLSFSGLLPFMKDVWPNLFGHQMIYLCRTAQRA